MRYGLPLIPVLLSLLSCSTAAGAEAKLPALGANAAKVSVSGLSSGAFMAVQYDVAFSASTIGAGIVAGGPYNCAYVNAGGILTCMQGLPIGALSLTAADGFAALGQIDPVGNIAKQKIYLFSGTKDTVVKQSAMNAVRDFYVAAKVPSKNLQYVNTMPAGHAFLSTTPENPCAVSQAPFVNTCQTSGKAYDQPAAILTKIYGPLKPKAAKLSSQPIAFDQSEFASALTSMAPTGYAYIPAACKKGAPSCAVHVVFHGCQQSAATVGDAVYAKTGYNAWADTNRIILLYPQVNASQTLPANPMGCWDWWGYSGLNFQTQSGPQLSAIKAMVARVTGS